MRAGNDPARARCSIWLRRTLTRANSAATKKPFANTRNRTKMISRAVMMCCPAGTGDTILDVKTEGCKLGQPRVGYSGGRFRSAMTPAPSGNDVAPPPNIEDYFLDELST